jgi:hypothetical protein
VIDDAVGGDRSVVIGGKGGETHPAVVQQAQCQHVLKNERAIGL